jgi:hypothetical protein
MRKSLSSLEKLDVRCNAESYDSLPGGREVGWLDDQRGFMMCTRKDKHVLVIRAKCTLDRQELCYGIVLTHDHSGSEAIVSSGEKNLTVVQRNGRKKHETLLRRRQRILCAEYTSPERVQLHRRWSASCVRLSKTCAVVGDTGSSGPEG